MRLFERIIPARRSPRNYLLLILVLTLATLAYFLSPQVRTATAATVAAAKAIDSALTWVLLGITALMLLLFGLIALVVMILRARIKREKIRRGLDGETLQVPDDSRTP